MRIHMHANKDVYIHDVTLTRACKQLAAAELDGKVYVAGGWDGNTYLSTMERYCPLDDK